jgi:hypothetical protein
MAREAPGRASGAGHMRPSRRAAKVRGGLGTQPSPGSVRTVSPPRAMSHGAVTRGLRTSQSAVSPGARPGAQRVE